MLVVAWASPVGLAGADGIAGATYTGVPNGGGAITFTVAADGTSLTSYRISDVAGSTCTFNAEGDAGIWEGAPIVDGWFEYRLHDAILLRGTFPGAQSASGTFRFSNHATQATAACDTGTVGWTATTTAAPPPSPTTGSPGATPGGGTPAVKPRFATRVVLRRLSRTRLGGRIQSRGSACRAGRTVTLWRGPRRIATTRSRADGTYSFARKAVVRNRRVRASVPARAGATAVCAPGSSRFIRA
ncbi:MAG TPA: hypothetical protein VFF79_06605 [Conexibacter sp.]|nr:hypothetical protein [Conexibacter sp.]